MQEYVVNSWLTVYTHIVHHNTPLQQMIRKITAIALRGDDVGTQRKWLIKRKPLNADSVVLVQVYLAVKVFCQIVNSGVRKLIHFADNHATGVTILQRTMKIKW